MRNQNHIINQRETYKLVENIAEGEYKSEEDMLSSLITDIVDSPEFDIIGGRLWKLNENDLTYELKSQYGQVKRIPDDYAISLDDNRSIFDKLSRKRTFLKRETDKVLLEKGIEIYSVTGVGDLVKTKYGSYYQYALGFNAPEILQSFFDTLQVISSVATLTIRSMAQKAIQQKMSDDMLKASEIQKQLLPDHYREFHDYKIFGACIPDREVGGDYFDYFDTSVEEDERLGIVISDAASKGLPAAVQALFVSGALRMGKAFAPKISQLISRLNKLIFDTFPYERFVTLLYLELTLSKNRLVLYANAGHCEPIHYRPSTGEARVLGSTGGLLGLVRNQKFGVENVRMLPGDIMLLYTDGISEAQDEKGNLFGEQRIVDIVKENYKLSSKEITYKVIEAVQKYSCKSMHTDDSTIVVIKRDEA